MEAFFDVKTNKPVDQIDMAQGETRILGLPQFNLNTVTVRAKDSKIVFVQNVIQLNQPKIAYNNRYDLQEVVSDSTLVVSKNSLYFQLAGNQSGTTELIAYFINNAGVAYARPVSVNVKENKKLLNLSPSVPFDTLWNNHPLKPGLNRDPKPCHKSGDSLVGQCMIRFCTALERSGISVKRLQQLGADRCSFHREGGEHSYHFINPYDFETKWPGLKQAYSWEANRPFQPEPMPGLAAYSFMLNRRGIVLFWKYFPTTKKGDMWGGHIDLWNRDKMGNTYDYAHPTLGLSAFARAHKITFWPLETV